MVLAILTAPLGALSCLFTAAEPCPGACVPVGAADVAVQDDGPPLDDVTVVLGLHRDHPSVKALVDWALPEGHNRNFHTIHGKGLYFKFEHDHVRYVAQEVREGPFEYRWPLMGGFDKDFDYKQLYNKKGWVRSRQEGVHGFRSPWTREIAGQTVSGIDVYANFHDETRKLMAVAAIVDLDGFWANTVEAVQKGIPADQFPAESWIPMLGTDIASDNGHLISAWIGRRIGSDTGRHGGVGMHFEDGRIVDSISFHQGFQGHLPLGLTLPPDPSALIQHFGPATKLSDVQHRWDLSFTNQPPMRVEFFTPVGAPRIVIGFLPGARPRWQALMEATGAPAPELVASVRELWTQAQAESVEPLKGRAETVHGLLGASTFWHSRLLLAGALGGTLYHDDTFPGLEHHGFHYPVRMARGEGLDPMALLAPFRAPFTAMLGEGWECIETAPDGKGTKASLAWETSDALPFDATPSLRVIASPLDGQPGFEISVDIIVPDA